MPYRSYQPGIQPGFLRGTYGTAWGNALGIIKDYFSDLAKQGVEQRWASFAQGEALAAIGAERGIPQGVNESTATYVESLLAAWEAWQLAGTPWAILALMNFLGYDDVYTVSQKGQIYGPSGSVELPNPMTGSPGVPPAVTSSGQKWTFAIGSTAFQSQGQQYAQQVSGGYTWNGIWLPNTAYGATATIYPDPPNGSYYINVGAAGTSGALPPVFPPNFGFQVTDGPDIQWYNIGTGEAEPVGQSQGTARTDFWSAYMLVFDPLPTTWTDIQNPPTWTSAPTLFEINAISALVSSFNAAHATCCGFYAPMVGTRAGFGWPVGRTFASDLNATVPSGVGVAPWTQFWIPHQSFPTGSHVVPTTPNGYWYKATTGGTSGYAQPSWPTTIGLTVVDGGVTWTCEGTTNTYLTGTGAPTDLGTVFQFVQQ